MSAPEFAGGHVPAGQKISYVYDYERLKEIRYPAAARNVVYEYGPPGAPENAAARITKVVDEVPRWTAKTGQ